MRKLFLLAIGILFSVSAPAQVSTKVSTSETSSANKLGWQLAVHSYTFQKFPILDAIDKTAALGVKYMSISGTVLLDGKRTGTLTLSDEQRATIDQRLKANGFGNFVNMGVVKLPADEAECRKVFEFAKKWGIGVLVSEPETNALDTVEKLCKEYNIKVAIHNHPKDSIYWNPDSVLAAIKGRTKLMGACADIGHWIRSGLDPLECLKKLDGRIISLHFKDLNEMGPNAHDVPWGTGVGKTKELMAELKRQNFRGVFCVEYEYNWENSGPEIAQSIKFFNQTCDELVASSPPARAAASDQIFYESRPAMGTSFEVYLYAPNRERASQLFEAAFEEIERVEAALSNYRSSSELSRINASAADAPVVTDPEVFALLERAFVYSRASNGPFDVTVGKLMKAWGFFRGAGHYPSSEELARARAQTGWRRVKLDQRTRSVLFLVRGIEIDLGGIGKGYALDCVARVLREAGVTAALIGSGSSSLYAIGAPPGKAGWTVRVPDPLDRTRTLSSILLKDQSLSTSGNYEKFFQLNGRKYCHIIDPRTGRPVEGMLQTSVIAPEATDSDALSTAVFVMGPEDSARLLDSVAGTSAIFVTDKTGAGRVVQVRWPNHAVSAGAVD